MKENNFKECIGMLNTLDENWDGDFCRLDNYAYTSIFSDMVPKDFIEKTVAS